MQASSKRSGLLGLVTVCIILFMAADVSAHDTWLFPRKADVPVGARVIIDMTSGMAFPRNETAIDPARIRTAQLRLAGRTEPLDKRVRGRASLQISARLTRAGVATIWVTLNPRTLDLTPAQVQEYMEEIGAADSIVALYPKSGPPKRWREQYVKVAKTIVVVGNGASDTSWAKPAGEDLEIVPVSNPARVVAGDTITFRVLRRGHPVANFPIGDVAANEHSTRLHHTDVHGFVRIKAPLKTSRWMLRATDLRRPDPGVDADWASVFATLTLAVR